MFANYYAHMLILSSRGHRFRPRPFDQEDKMFSVDTQIPILQIFTFIVGPAIVWLSTMKAGLSIGIAKKFNLPITGTDNSQVSPLWNPLTFTLFPLVLALALWFLNLVNFSPYQGLNVNYVAMLSEQFWFVKYFVFIFIMQVLGYCIGWLFAMASGVALKTFGVRIPDQNRPAAS